MKSSQAAKEGRVVGASVEVEAEMRVESVG